MVGLSDSLFEASEELGAMERIADDVPGVRHGSGVGDAATELQKLRYLPDSDYDKLVALELPPSAPGGAVSAAVDGREPSASGVSDGVGGVDGRGARVCSAVSRRAAVT